MKQGKNNKKKVIIVTIGILVLIVIIITIGILAKRQTENNEEVNNIQNQTEEVKNKFTAELDNGTKINTSKDFNTPKTYKNLEISNIQFTEENGISTLLADIKNTDNMKHEKEEIEIIIIDENDQEIAKIDSVIGKINPGETIKLNASITSNTIDAKDFIIKEK